MAHQRNLLYMNLLSDFLASETQMLQPEALSRLLDQQRHRPNILRENKLPIPDQVSQYSLFQDTLPVVLRSFTINF